MNTINHAITAQGRDDVDLLVRGDKGLGYHLRTLACGHWDTAVESHRRVYETYCQTQWNYFAQGRRRFEHHSHETTEIILMIQKDDVKESILTQLQNSHQAEQKSISEHNCGHMIDFAARLIIPINIGTLPNEVNKRRHLKWNTGTLKNCITEYFNERPSLTFERLRLPKAFDVWSICKIGGITIRFTDNLADHLLLVEDDAVVLIFHHVTYLEQQGQEYVPRSEVA